MSKAPERDPAEILIAELNGVCGGHVMAGINGNIPDRWYSSGLWARRSIDGTVEVTVSALRGPEDAGVGGKINVSVDIPSPDLHLKIADLLAEQIRAAIDRRLMQDGRLVRVALAPGAKLPQRKTAGASGYDLCALEECWVRSGQVAKISTGVHLEMPPGTEAQVRGRSGWAMRGLWVHTATVDQDYRGPVWVIISNLTDQPIAITAGDRIAQLVFARVELPELKVVAVGALTPTDRGECGLGSTGDFG